MTPGLGSAAPRVSVVVPFYDSEDTVEACARGLLAQQGADGHEILFVDNGSTDGSRERLAGIEGVEVLEERTPGAYAARNAGIRRATGEILAFTDADCVVDPDWLVRIVARMADPSVGALVGHSRYPANASLGLRLLGRYENAKVDYVLDRCPREQHFAYTNNMAVRAALFEELGPFREWKRAADSEFVHRMADRRPDLRLIYCADVAMTHLEFTDGRSRANRLSLYTETNSQIATFRELSTWQRFRIVWHAMWGGGSR